MDDHPFVYEDHYLDQYENGVGLVDIVDNAEEESSDEFTYDLNVAPRHDYLGTDLVDLRGRTLYDEGSELILPIVVDPITLLIPGQTFPITVANPQIVQSIKEVIDKEKTFGVVLTKLWLHNPRVGTTAEIIQYSLASNVLTILAKGRQRFVLIDENARPGEPCKIRILPESSLNALRSEARLSCLNRFRLNKNFRSRHGAADFACVSWPFWLLDQFDAKMLVKRVVQALHNWSKSSLQDNVPTDPVSLSFWVLQSLPADIEFRMHVLVMDSAIERLQLSIQLLNEFSEMFCQKCETLLSIRKHIISMSAEGPTGSYCNPGGYVHDILTVNKVFGVKVNDEPPESSHSWFPGYGWTIMKCRCRNHVGWMFNALNDKLHPRVFYALGRSSIAISRYNDEPFDCFRS